MLKFALVSTVFTFIYNDITYKVYQFTNIGDYRHKGKRFKYSISIHQVYPKPNKFGYASYCNKLFSIDDAIKIIDLKNGR